MRGHLSVLAALVGTVLMVPCCKPTDLSGTQTRRAQHPAPVALKAIFSGDEDTQLLGQLKAETSPVNAARFVMLVPPQNGILTRLNADTGEFEYQPNPDYFGRDAFYFGVEYSGGISSAALVELTLKPVNDAPVASPGTLTLDEDVVAVGRLEASDVDSRSLIYSTTVSPTRGTVTITDAATGAYSYLPSANAFGTDSFKFKVNDGPSETAKDSVEKEITLTIRPINDAPVALTVAVTTNEETLVMGNLVATDVDTLPANITYAFTSTPARGTLTLLSATTGAFSYLPALDDNANATFTYEATDSTFLVSNTATVTIQITPVNDRPVVTGQSLTTNEDTEINGTLTGSDVDSSNLTFSVTSPTTAGGTVAIVSAAAGTFTYTPRANFSGDDSFSFKLNDGFLDSETGVVNIQVNAVNDEPVATDSTFVVRNDQIVSSKAIAVDPENDSLSFRVVSAPTSGTLAMNNDGTFTFTPPVGVSGEQSFTFKASDSSLDSKIATIRLRASPVWTAQLGGTGNDQFFSMAPASLGELIAVGESDAEFEGRTNLGGFDAIVTKLDSAGSVVWKKQLGGAEEDVAFGVKVDAGGNSYVVGKTSGEFEGETSFGQIDAFVVKIDASGNVVWKKQFGSSGDDIFYAVALDGAGNVIVAGEAGGALLDQPNTGASDAFVVKLNPEGTVLWAKQLGGVDFDQLNSVSVGADGSVITCGMTTGSFTGLSNKGRADAIAFKLDALGQLVWKIQIGSDEDDFAKSVSVHAQSGDIVLVGSTQGAFEVLSHLGGTDAFAVSVKAADGEIIWKKQLGTPGEDEFNAITDSLSGFVIAGETDQSFMGLTHLGAKDALVVKLDELGNTVWKQQLGSAQSDSAMGIARGQGSLFADGIFMVGSTEGQVGSTSSLGLVDAIAIKLLENPVL